jgi:polysaccharide export outer membrane protein
MVITVITEIKATTGKRRNKMRTLRLLVIMLLSAGVCYAQNESLTIGPGDMVTVQVLEAPELLQHVRVSDAGDVQLIVGGNVHIAALTTNDAANAIKQALITGNYFKSPHVSVSVDRYATRNVSVLGQVRLPGSYFIETPRSILDVIALSGGITDAADRRITIERYGTKDKVQFFFSNDATAAMDSNVTVYPGDRVYVPKVPLVYVLGDVGRPGGFPMDTPTMQLSVLQAVALAGATRPTAVPSHSRLIRKMKDGSYEEIEVPLSAMQKGKKADFELQADDILYVPFSYLRNAALGITSLVAAASTASIYRF